jgi:hypothetical protein
MADWADLERELDAWETAGEAAWLWWRDDDAATDSPALRRLIELTLAAATPLPITLAVIPARAETTLAQALRSRRHVAFLQHGYAHVNHAAAGAKKAEFPAGRDVARALRELELGFRRMENLFGGRALPVLVPPWNRIDPALVERLPEIGFHGLSSYGSHRPSGDGTSLAIVNTHVDIMRWHGAREFLGTENCLDLAIAHLQARRHGRADRSEATGILTHHLVHDAGAWQFLAEFVRRTLSHPGARWMHAVELFGCGEGHVA